MKHKHITHPQGEPVRIMQISDCHLPQNPATPFRGQSADDGLQILMRRIAAWQPQVLLATGDLSEDASSASYGRLRHYFKQIDAPLFVLPGNHDDKSAMQSYFDDGPWDGPLCVHLGDWQLVLLNSAQAGRIDGAVNREDIQSLRLWLETEPRKSVVLALHHHPVAMDSLWIDRYRLETPEELLSLVENYEQIRGVVWGHVHQAFESKHASASLLACPSTAVNSLPASVRFEPDPAGPACRWMQLHPQGEIETGLLFAKE